MDFASTFAHLRANPRFADTLDQQLQFPAQVFSQLRPREQTQFVDRLSGLSGADANYLFNSIADTGLQEGTATFRQFISSPRGQDYPFLLASSELPFSPTQQITLAPNVVQGQLGIPVRSFGGSWRSSWGY